MSTLTVPDALFHQIEERARASGKTVEVEAVELLAKALNEDLAEAELMAEIRKERDEMAARGVFLTNESIAEAKNWGRE
jgi:hypothetical protein